MHLSLPTLAFRARVFGLAFNHTAWYSLSLVLIGISTSPAYIR